MMTITDNFTLEEMLASATAKAKGITNQPTTQAVINLTKLVLNVLQPLREAMNEPIKIGSGFRCQALNKAVGGVSNSQHMTGQAADLCIDGDVEKGKRWYKFITAYCDFDQCFWEHNSKGSYWIHVSYVSKKKNRHYAKYLEVK